MLPTSNRINNIKKWGCIMSNIKAFQIRMPRDLWVFLKKKSITKEKPMNVLIIELLEKDKKNSEKKLTHDNTMIS